VPLAQAQPNPTIGAGLATGHGADLRNQQMIGRNARRAART
jgi:hypothetical protein